MSDPVINPEQELESQIEAELAEYKARLEKLEYDKELLDELSSDDERTANFVRSRYMNNFWTRFPGGHKGRDIDQRPEINAELGIGWDIPHRVFYENLPEQKGDRSLAERSEKYLNETPRQFLQEIIAAIAEAGVSSTDIKEFMARKKGIDHDKYTTLFFPIYKKMRLRERV